MTFFTTKNPTQWIAPSGEGYIQNVGNMGIFENTTLLPIVANGNLIPIVITPLQWNTKYITTWSSTGV